MLIKTLYSDTQLAEHQILSEKKYNKDQSILLIDDNHIVVTDLKLRLQAFCSNRVIVKFNAEDALNYLFRYPKDVAFVLSDINLPGMTGTDLLRKIKLLSFLRHIPVLLQSGGTLTWQEAIELGASGFLHKPYTKAELYAAIYKLIDEFGLKLKLTNLRTISK